MNNCQFAFLRFHCQKICTCRCFSCAKQVSNEIYLLSNGYIKQIVPMGRLIQSLAERHSKRGRKDVAFSTFLLLKINDCRMVFVTHSLLQHRNRICFRTKNFLLFSKRSNIHFDISKWKSQASCENSFIYTKQQQQQRNCVHHFSFSFRARAGAYTQHGPENETFTIYVILSLFTGAVYK